jgi:transcriptional regulator with XRE-family HTH domain
MRGTRLRQVRNLAHLDRDTGYRWSEADPILEFLRNDITDSGWSVSYLAERSGLSTTTIRNIQGGKTKHIFNSTVEALLRALGWGRPVRNISQDQ